MKRVFIIQISNLLLLCIGILGYLNNDKIDENRISVLPYENCFDNLSEIKFCDLKDGKTYKIHSLNQDSIILVGDSHAFVTAEILRLMYERYATDRTNFPSIYFSGVSSCLPVPGFIHEVNNRVGACTKLASIANSHTGQVIFGAKWLKYGMEYVNKVRSDALIIEQAPKFTLPPLAMPVSNQDILSRISVADYILQLKIVETFEHNALNPYLDTICNGNVCEMQKNGFWLYADNNHLSDFGARWVAGNVEQSFFEEILGNVN